MRNHLFFSIAAISALLPISALCADKSLVSFRGNSLHAITVEPDKNTGLDNIFVLYDTSGVDLLFKSASPSTVRFYRYGNLGGGYAEELSDVSSEDNNAVLHDVKGDYGYIIEEGDRRYYFWIVNYLPYRFSLSSVSAYEVQDCDATMLAVEGNGEPIHYFTINGQQKELSRDIKVEYDTQEFDSSAMEYRIVNQVKTISSFDKTIRISPASLCHTFFKISGDRFLKDWNWGVEIESAVIAPNAVAVTTEAIQDSSDASIDDDESGDMSDNENENESMTEGSNIIKGDESSFGGSAPADISFVAYTSEGVMHYEWQMSRDSEFDEIDYRFNVRELDYTFLEEGDYYLRFIGSNSDGSCESIGDTYTVSIGSSELLCPNAFTPDGDGVNDIWKVSYRSIVEFDCWIFDRYGGEIFHFSDPQSGWDGKRGGRTVSPGVYYYVITAVGADGKKYKLSGDINILRRRVINNSNGDDSE